MGVSYVVMGHTTLDNVISTDGSAYFHVAGGAGLYATSGAAYWCRSKEVGVVTKLGRQFKKEDEDCIKGHAGVDGSGLIRMDRVGIKLWMLFDEDGYRNWVLQHVSWSRESAAPEPQNIPEAYLKSAKGYHLSPLPPESVERLLDCIPKEAYIQLDPHYEWFYPQFLPEWKRILPRLDTVLPSEDELCKFFDIPYGSPLSTILEYAKRLSDMGPETVVVKLGSKGAMVYDGVSNQGILVPSCAEQVIDATGAGDTFGGSFLVSRTEGEPLETAMIKGAVGASLTLEHKGVIENFRLPVGMAQQRYSERVAKLTSSMELIH